MSVYKWVIPISQTSKASELLDLKFNGSKILGSKRFSLSPDLERRDRSITVEKNGLKTLIWNYKHKLLSYIRWHFR